MPIVELHHGLGPGNDSSQTILLHSTPEFKKFFMRVSKYEDWLDSNSGYLLCKMGGKYVDLMSVLNTLDKLGFKVVAVRESSDSQTCTYTLQNDTAQWEETLRAASMLKEAV